MRDRVLGPLFLLLALSAADCGLTGLGSRAARVRHAYTFGCPAEAVRVEPARDSRFVATGCGMRAVYVCVRGMSHVECIREGQATTATAPTADTARRVLESTRLHDDARRIESVRPRARSGVGGGAGEMDEPAAG